MNDRIEWTLDTGQTSVYEYPEMLLHEESRFVFRLNHQLPLYVARSPDPGAIAACGCINIGFESMDIIHTPSNYTAEQNSTQTSSGQSIDFGDVHHCRSARASKVRVACFF